MALMIDELLRLSGTDFQRSLKVESFPASGFSGKVAATALEMGQEPGQFLSIPVIPLVE